MEFESSKITISPGVKLNLGREAQENFEAITFSQFQKLETAVKTIAGSDVNYDTLTELKVYVDVIKNTNIENLASRVTTVENSVTSVKNSVTSVENRVTTVEPKVTAVETKVGMLETKVTTVENRVTTVENGVGAVENRVTTVESKVTAVEPKVGMLETKVEDLANSNKGSYLTTYRDVSDTYTSANPFVFFNGVVPLSSPDITMVSAPNQGTKFTVSRDGIYYIDYKLFADATGTVDAFPNFDVVDTNGNRIPNTPSLSVPKNSWDGILSSSFMVKLLAGNTIRIRLTNYSSTSFPFLGFTTSTSNGLTTFNSPGSNNTSALFTIFRIAD
jgi:archaellum component FlaC